MKYCTTCHAAYPSDVNSCPTDNSVLSTTSELVQGMIVRGKYEILNKIGVGGMAAVYRARHVAFDEIRAIKVVRGWLAEDDDFVHRLRSEAVIARKLKHPNAVHVDDLDELEDGRPFIVMEYVEGTDLRRVIRQGGPMPAARALNIARQVASALSAAHRLGIVHRDIKPDNIVLVSGDGSDEQVKVLDFGIAKLRGGTGSAKFETRHGVVLCTPEYASPEQARGLRAEELDGRSDLYSLGIVMYEMVTGTLPFHSDTPLGTLLAHINTLPRLPSDVQPQLNVAPEVSALLMKALEKDPAKRFQTGEELVEAIAKLEKGNQTGLSTSGVPVHAAAPEPTPHADGQYLLSGLEDEGKRSHLWMYAALVVLLLVAASAFWWWKRTEQSSASSQALDRRVQRTMASSPASHIHAEVADGVVVLSGEATGSDAVDELAAKLAGLEGVFRVDRHNVRIVSASNSGPPNAAANPGPPPMPAAKPVPQPVAEAKPAEPEPSKKPVAALPNEAPDTPAPNAREAAPARNDPRIADELMHAREAHDQGAYDDEIGHYNKVLKIDPKNPAALRGRQKALRAKQADPGAQLDAEQP